MFRDPIIMLEFRRVRRHLRRKDKQMSDEKKMALDAEKKFEVCPDCGYEGGFHILLEKVTTSGSENVKIRLKCPSCSKVYDFNLHAVAL